ncbi:hypothetical protein GOP47_0021222 [Adiantum capillus-veneris]|uniref:Uncharacterized protein n=1 Tax=Adiantum capillus-veneris TaxID=13818 RepID=A0A9D4Z8G4_ADICA|nr:hypothetical protein GOP47_0021222 [Adiantum capillus-veneris]
MLQGRLEIPEMRSMCTHPKLNPEVGGDADVEVLVVLGLLDLPIIHDFAITRKYIIFPDFELLMSPLEFLCGEPGQWKGVAKRDPHKVARFCVLLHDNFDRPHQATQKARWFDAPGRCNSMEEQ